jgi:hypothetical protein
MPKRIRLLIGLSLYSSSSKDIFFISLNLPFLSTSRNIKNRAFGAGIKLKIVLSLSEFILHIQKFRRGRDRLSSRVLKSLIIFGEIFQALLENHQEDLFSQLPF